MSRSILERNLLCLANTSSPAAKLIGSTEDSDEVFFKSSRDGSLIPVMKTSKGDRPIHSSINPVKEGEKLSSQYLNCGTLLAFGLGGGYHLLPLLSSHSLTNLIVIETDASIIRTILSSLDLTALFLDKRVSLWISDVPEDFKSYLLSKYIPVLHGDLQSISLRSRVDCSPDFFLNLTPVIKESISMITDDYTVQTHFGKKWFINTLANLKSSEETVLALKPVHKVQITAAGPGLEKQMNHLISNRNGSTLIATDTSLPVLLENNVIPDMVISIDCQHISYHHFMAGYPHDVPLILDLASPPFMTRIARKVFFFTSDHPFSNYVSSHFRNFPRIDTSGGNVTHAAVSLAESLGARVIDLYGADFSYPFGKPYARGSYIYPYFHRNSLRFNGIENQFINFIFHNKSLYKEPLNGGFRYISKPMIHYKNSLEGKANIMRAQIRNVRGDGVELNLNGSRGSKQEQYRFISAGETFVSRNDFLKELRENIMSLPAVTESIGDYMSSLNQEQRLVLMSILPAAAQFRRTTASGCEALNQAKKWTMEILERQVHHV